MVLRGAAVGGVAARVDLGLSGTLFEDCLITTSSGSGAIGIVGTENVTVRRCTLQNLVDGILATDLLVPPCSSRAGTLTIDTCVFDACGADFNCVATGSLCFSTMDGAPLYAVRGLPSSNSIVDRTIFTNCSTVFSNGCPATFTQCLLYNNTSLGTGCSATGQLTDDPLFCNSREGLPQKYTLRIDSPAINNSWGVQIGAKGTECAWGSLARTSVVKVDASVFGLEDVTIPTGMILTVKDGVTFKWDDDDNGAGGDDSAENELITCGKLRINGTSAKPVTLTSSKTSPAEGDWAGVVVTPDAAAKINYTTIKYAGDAVRSVYTADSTTVSNSTFLYNELHDINVAGDNSHAVSITSNTVTVGDGIGIAALASEAVISGNSVTCNSLSEYGIELAADNNQIVSSNTVQGASMGAALWIGGNANKTPAIKDNSFTNSKFGIECVNSKANIGASDHENTITGNTTGVLVDGSNAKPKLRYNDISSNSTGVSAMNSGDPDMGTNADGGNNKFLSNSTYCINNRNTSGTLSAKGNFFGNPGGCPTPACFTGSVDVSSWLCTAPFTVEIAMRALPNKPEGFRLLGVRPNPARSGANLEFAMESGTADILVEVFDLAGRLVRRLDTMNAGIGEHELFWDGRDERGALVQTGVYFFRASGHGIHEQSVKLLVVR